MNKFDQNEIDFLYQEKVNFSIHTLLSKEILKLCHPLKFYNL